MLYRKVGKSELEISPIGMGCWSFGGGEYWGEQSQKDVEEVVNSALDNGINFFDTAEMYNQGSSEESLGKALKGRRKEAIILTKASPANAYPDTLRKACEDSLKRLQTDYIDLYMFHWPIASHSIRHFTNDESIINNPPSVQEAFDTMVQLQEEGKVRYVGVSNFGVEQMKEALATGVEMLLLGIY